MRVVELREVSVRAAGAPLRRLDLAVRAGELVLLLGDAGVSTAVRTLAGALVPAAGAVRVDGDDVTGKAGAATGALLVPAGWTPFAGLTVFENVLVGARGSRAAAAAVLDRVPLLPPDAPADDLAPHDVRLLALSVALARRPRLLLVDGLRAGAGVAGYAVALGALRASGVTAVMAERAAFDGRSVVVPERLAPEQYDRVFVMRDGAVFTGTPGWSAPLSTDVSRPR